MPITRRALYLRGTIARASTYWRGSRSLQSQPAAAILTESSDAISTETGLLIETEV